MFGLGTPELILILVIVVVLFGGSKLPEIGSGVGRMISNFKKASREGDEPGKPPQKDGPEGPKKG